MSNHLDLLIDTPTRVKCDACHKPITLAPASIYSGTADGKREHFHLACCPWLQRPTAEAAL